MENEEILSLPLCAWGQAASLRDPGFAALDGRKQSGDLSHWTDKKI